MVVTLVLCTKRGSPVRNVAGSGFRTVSINARASVPDAIARGGTNPSVTSKIFLKKYFRRTRHKIIVII